MIATGGALVWNARTARRRMEARVSVLEKQLAADRRARLALEMALAAERKRIAGLTAARESETAERLAAIRAESGRLRSALEEARARAEASAAEIGALEAELRKEREALATVERERSAGERVIRSYQKGVGLVDGGYRFVDAGGSPFRSSSVSGEPGEPYEQDFTGTGFLVSASGWVLTNRHVAEPWWGEEETARLASRGFGPRLTRLRVYFPGLAEPFPLRVVSVSPDADVALLRCDPGKARLPVLETDGSPAAAVAGQPVVLLGYPAGLDALLARLDPLALDAFLATSGRGADQLAAEVARRGLVRPLATQGHLGDVLPGQLVYDALTTVGASGGPVFNTQGKVIGINAAFLSEFSGASFGVPIRFGLTLVEAAERRAPPAAPKRKPRR